MAVVGHAFVGLAIGLSSAPGPESRSSRAIQRAAWWIPSVVILAYLPDIVAQLLLLGGWRAGGLLGHSLPFAVTASALAAAGLTRLAPVSSRRAFATALLAILLHDLLDLAEASDRRPFWPLSHRRLGYEVPFLPSGALGETVLYGSAFLIFLVLSRLARGRARRPQPSVPRATAGPDPIAGIGVTITGAIMTVALVTHALRDARERHLETARTFVGQGHYQAALDELRQGERWPSTAKAGRIDYLRAEAYAGLGDRQRAEPFYLSAYEADPTYFWVVADLALFYASSPRPVAERRQLIEPYVHRMESEFAGHAALPGVLARLEERLARVPAVDAMGSTPRGGQPGS